MRSISVSSRRSARPRLARMLALTVALFVYERWPPPAALAAGGTAIEVVSAQTSLVQVGDNFYFYPVGGSSGPLLKYSRARRSRWGTISA